jgi:hypothetical protein
MPRVYIVRSAWQQVQEQAETLNEQPRKLLSRIIEERAQALDRGNRHLAEQFDIVPAREVASVVVSNLAWRIAGDLSMALSLRIQSVVTYLVEDALPVMRALPEVFVPRHTQANMPPPPKRPQIGLRGDVYVRLYERVSRLRQQGEQTSVEQYVFALLQSLTPLEINRRLSSPECVIWREGPGNRGITSRPIHMSEATYQLFRLLKKRYGFPMSAIFTYLVMEELDVISRLKFEPNLDALNEERWEEMLNEMLLTGADGRPL